MTVTDMKIQRFGAKSQGVSARNADALLRSLDITPEFVEGAKAALFLAGLEKKETFELEIDGETVALNLPYLAGTNIKGTKGTSFVPLVYIPAFFQLLEGFSRIENDKPMEQNTIMRRVLHDSDEYLVSKLQKFFDEFATHPSIEFADAMRRFMYEAAGRPDQFEPIYGDDHTARSRLYNEMVMIEGEVYAVLSQYNLSGALEFFTRAARYVHALDYKSSEDETLSALREAFEATGTPADLDFWRRLFKGAGPDGAYGFSSKVLLDGSEQTQKRGVLGLSWIRRFLLEE